MTNPYSIRDLYKLVIVSAVGAIALVLVELSNPNEFVCDITPHTVETGDTLWSIASSKCDGNLNSVINNSFHAYGEVLFAGQRIYLPANESCELLFKDGDIYENCE